MWAFDMLAPACAHRRSRRETMNWRVACCVVTAAVVLLHAGYASADEEAGDMAAINPPSPEIASATATRPETLVPAVDDPWCKTVTLPSSIAICSDPELWALATERSRIFGELHHGLSPADWRALVADQKAWVRTYASACGVDPKTAPTLPLAPQIKDCMLRAGQARIEYLRHYGGTPPESKPDEQVASSPPSREPAKTTPQPSDDSENDEPVTVLGMELDRPFTVPRCPEGADNFAVPYTCWKPFPGGGEIGGRLTRQVFTKKFVVPEIYATTLKGNLYEIEFDTAGIKDQDYVLSLLEEKFGKPMIFDKVDLQNGFGAKFTGYDVSWDSSKVHVSFQSYDLSNIYQGVVRIQTPRSYKEYIKELDRSFKTRSKL